MTDMTLRKRRLRVVSSVPEPDALLRKAARGDREAYGHFYDLVIDQVFGISRTVIRDRMLAEENAQEVMVEVWRKAPLFDPARGSATAWVSTIAHRRAVDRVRSEESRKRREERTHVHEVQDEANADALITAETQTEMQSAMKTLTATQREAVQLAFYDGRTHTEVAEILGIPLGTAKTRIRDGLIKLRDAVEADASDKLGGSNERRNR